MMASSVKRATARAADSRILDASANGLRLFEPRSRYQDLMFTLATYARMAALVLRRHENRPDVAVGRVNYSLSPTQSAQFRQSVRASERLYIVP